MTMVSIHWCAIVTPFKNIEVAFLPLASSAQQSELPALTRACILAKEKTVNTYSDCTYAFGVVHDIGMLWTKPGFRTFSKDKIINGSCIRNYWILYFSLMLFLLLRSQDVLNLTEIL